MNLKDLTDKDLALLLNVFRTLAEGNNRVAIDIGAIVEAEGLSRRRPTDIADYTDADLVRTIEDLKSFVEHNRAAGVSDNCPYMQFVLENMTVLIDEAEKRDLIKLPQ